MTSSLRVATALLAVALVATPFASSNHSQTENGRTVAFDHRTGNEWWVEVTLSGASAASAVKVEAMDTGGAWTNLPKQSWGAYGASFHIEPGHQVRFRATWSDGDVVTSCWFTHPAGVEQCGSTTTPPPPPPPGTFDAGFTGFRGSEWWVQASVATNGPAIQSVDVRAYANGAWGSFMPVAKHSWGWGSSYHFPQGSILQMRATATDGQRDLSSCRQWIPPQGQDATIVACPGTTPPPPGAFDATFTGVKGNHYWVQVNVAANEPLKGVAFRINCAPSWIPLAKQSWGGWAPTHQVIIPQGSKVDFKATSLDGDRDASGGYIWTAATPTTGCALGAWPAPGSRVVYDLSSGVCGGGECFHADGTLSLTYQAENYWKGVCVGRNTHTRTDGTQSTEDWVGGGMDLTPLFGKVPTSVGAQQDFRRVGVFYSAKSCGVGGNDIPYVVDHRETRQTALVDANHNPISLDAWVAERDEAGENYEVVAFDAKLGMVFETQSYPRMSQQGSASLYLTDTDAPIR